MSGSKRMKSIDLYQYIKALEKENQELRKKLSSTPINSENDIDDLEVQSHLGTTEFEDLIIELSSDISQERKNEIRKELFRRGYNAALYE